MKKFALIALLALVSTPVFAANITEDSASATVTLTLEQFVSIDITSTNFAFTSSPQVDTNGNLTGFSKATLNVDYAWKANTPADIWAALSSISGLTSKWAVTPDSSAKVGVNLAAGDPNTGVGTAVVTVDGIVIGDDAGQYTATLTLNIKARP